MVRTNKKKNKQKQKGRKNKGGQPSPRTANDGNFNDQFYPSSSSAGGDTNAGSKEHRTIYAQYKEATRSFRDGLSKLLPKSIPLTSVSDLGNAVEYILHKSETTTRPLVVGISLLSCLNESIKLREEITVSVAGADDGHAYMNSMLRYCQGVLRKCRKIFVASQGKSQKSEGTNKMNCIDIDDEANKDVSDRFGLLSVNDDEEESEEDEPVVRPPNPDREYSIEKDLIEGDVAMQAKMFIFQTNVLMEMVTYHFRLLKVYVERVKEVELQHDGFTSSITDGLIAMHTMTCSACVNLVLEEIKYIEEALVAEAPSLKTYYHVVAILIFGSFVENLQGCVSPESLTKDPNIILDLVAKAVEYGFRTPADGGYYRFEQRAAQFAKHTKMDSGGIKNIIFLIQSITFLEVAPRWVVNDKRLQALIHESRKNLDKLFAIGLPSDLSQMWHVLSLGKNMVLKEADGDDEASYTRGILRTQSRLQLCVHDLPPCDSLATFVADPSIRYCEAKWDEKVNQSKSIDDSKMDDFFFGTFHYTFITHVRQYGEKSQQIFDLDFHGLLSRFDPLLQGYLNYVKDRDAVVPYSFTLSVHSMLSGVLHLQGDLERIALASRNASDKFYNQIQWIIDQGCTESAKRNLIAIKARQKSNSFTSEGSSNLLALWNPLTAGCILGQVTFLNNMRNAALDKDNQMVTILHLFNALKARNILQEDDIEYIKSIDAILDTSKAIWGGQKPTSGFCKSFYVACGYPGSASKKMAEFVESLPWTMFKTAIENASSEKKAQVEAMCRQNMAMEGDVYLERMKLLVCISNCEVFRAGNRKEARSIKPEEICASYPCMVDRDFSGIVDYDFSRGNDMSIIGTGSLVSSFLNHYDRQKALREKIAEEYAKKQILSVNLRKLSWIFADAAKKLPIYMGWSDIIDSCCSLYPPPSGVEEKDNRRYFVDILIGDRILGELDCDLDAKKCGESVKAAKFLKSYFSSLKEDDVSFF